jgi:hypothetical protein
MLATIINFPEQTKMIGRNKIAKDSTIILENGGYYFEDIKTYIHLYSDSIVLINIENALKAGKCCQRYSVNYDNFKSNTTMYCDLVNAGVDTFFKLFFAITGNFIQEINPMFKVCTGEIKGVRTFSPFVSIKPIKVPAKWTVSHIVKAILSGQISEGVKAGHYTDDYAYDAADNFGKGKQLDLLDLAKELIEHPDGWWCKVEKAGKESIELSVNCHSFDYNKVTFKI